MTNERLVVNSRSSNLAAKQIRKKGCVPGVVYGSGCNTVLVEIDSKSLSQMIKKVGQGVLFEIAMENKIDAVRIRELQRDPITNQIIHVDMQRVDKNQIVKAEVPLKFEGIKNLANRGTAIQFQKDKVKIEAHAKDIPSCIQVNLKDIKPGQDFYVYNLELADELTVIDDKNELIFTAVKNTEKESDKSLEKEKNKEQEETYNNKKEGIQEGSN